MVAASTDPMTGVMDPMTGVTDPMTGVGRGSY